MAGIGSKPPIGGGESGNFRELDPLIGKKRDKLVVTTAPGGGEGEKVLTFESGLRRMVSSPTKAENIESLGKVLRYIERESGKSVRTAVESANAPGSKYSIGEYRALGLPVSSALVGQIKELAQEARMAERAEEAARLSETAKAEAAIAGHAPAPELFAAFVASGLRPMLDGMGAPGGDDLLRRAAVGIRTELDGPGGGGLAGGAGVSGPVHSWMQAMERDVMRKADASLAPVTPDWTRATAAAFMDRYKGDIARGDSPQNVPALR